MAKYPFEFWAPIALSIAAVVAFVMPAIRLILSISGGILNV